MNLFRMVWLALGALVVPAFGEPGPAAPDAAAPARVVIIPIREPIAKPELFILRRGLKQAIAEQADTVILDMKTPGGALDVTLAMMEALDRFPGRKITYVNDEAISAGAIIASVTDEIHFSPKATIGAAEVIMGTGQDVSEGLKRKLNSYMGAKIRSYSEGSPQRADVIRAMMDPEFALKIGENMIKPKGELLSLTSLEALALHGTPPTPLLGTGIATDLDALVQSLYGNNVQVQRLHITWSEKAAQYLTAITPLLLGIGMLALFIEFKTPGFGIFGIAGLTVLAVVFLGQYVAGLSGHEPLLLFLLGVLLVAVELLFFPGILVGVVTGAALMMGSLVWAMLDHWPNQALPLHGQALALPIAQVASGMLIALVLFFVLLKILPKGSPLGGFVLDAAIAGAPSPSMPVVFSRDAPHGQALIGLEGQAVTALFPSGQVEIGGHRYEARLAVGCADPGTVVRVREAKEFGLIVEVLT